MAHGKQVLVDDQDYDSLVCHGWHASKSAYNWYAVRFVKTNGHQEKIYMHRLIMNAPADKVTHHRDGNSLNNQRSNLVVVSKSENLSYRIWKKK